MYRLFFLLVVLKKLQKRNRPERIKNNCQRNDSYNIIIRRGCTLLSEDLQCTSLHDLLFNHLYSSIIVCVSSRNYIRKFSGVLLKVTPEFIVLLSTRYIRLPFRTIYNSKFITIPIDKIAAVSYPP